MEELLAKLTELFYIKDSQKNIKILIKELSKYCEVIVDKNGNIIGTLGAKNSKNHIMLDAHLDQVGLIVTNILDGGFVKVAQYGGIDCKVLPGSRLNIYGKEIITGIVFSTPPHLSNKNSDKYLKVEELHIDTGLTKEEIEKMIPLYSYVGFSTKPQKLLNNNMIAAGLDNRASIATLVQCAKYLSRTELNCKVSIVFSVGEETTGCGAKTASFEVSPQEAIAVDVSFGTQPDISSENKGILGQGPMVGFSPAISDEIAHKLVKIAKKNDIPYQFEIMSGKTGTNADAISVTKSGIKTGLVSIPIRNMHTPVEVVNLADIKNTAKLLSLYVKKCGTTSS